MYFWKQNASVKLKSIETPEEVIKRNNNENSKMSKTKKLNPKKYILKE